MRRFDEQTLIVTGRDIGIKATVAWFSTDSGKRWCELIKKVWEADPLLCPKKHLVDSPAQFCYFPL